MSPEETVRALLGAAGVHIGGQELQAIVADYPVLRQQADRMRRAAVESAGSLHLRQAASDEVTS